MTHKPRPTRFVFLCTEDEVKTLDTFMDRYRLRTRGATVRALMALAYASTTVPQLQRQGGPYLIAIPMPEEDQVRLTQWKSRYSDLRTKTEAIKSLIQIGYDEVERQQLTSLDLSRIVRTEGRTVMGKPIKTTA